MNILILAAGTGPSNTAGQREPLCLSEFGGKVLIELIYDAIRPLNPQNIVIAFREEDIRKYHLDNIAKLLSSKSIILKTRDQTQGAACTALLASDIINSDEELIVMNGNDLINVDFAKVIKEFHDRNLDAGTMTFASYHPRYSYVREDGFVTEAAEKRPISRHATAGFYWFRKGSEFVQGVMDMIRKGADVNGLFYICPAFNELILLQKKIGIFELSKEQYHPLKSEKQIELYETALERSETKGGA